MRQVLSAVDYMHSLSLVHTDLKPENILLTDESTVVVAHPPGSNLGRKLPTKSDVRLIDFGSAAFDEDYHSSIVSTRHYRAPEIVLGFGWSKPCDMWSLGCIFVELLTGDALFQTHENLEHLAMMQAVLGPMPKEMAARASEGPFQVRSLFRRGPRTPARLNWPEGAEGKKSLRAVAKMETIQKHLATRCDESVQPYVGAITGEKALLEGRQGAD